MSPSPPTNQIGDQEKDLQKHVGIKTDLKEKKEQQHNIYSADTPTPNIGARRQPYGYTARDGPEELEITHLVTKDGEEYIFNVEKVHRIVKDGEKFLFF